MPRPRFAGNNNSRAAAITQAKRMQSKLNQSDDLVSLDESTHAPESSLDSVAPVSSIYSGYSGQPSVYIAQEAASPVPGLQDHGVMVIEKSAAITESVADRHVSSTSSLDLIDSNSSVAETSAGSEIGITAAEASGKDSPVAIVSGGAAAVETGYGQDLFNVAAAEDVKTAIERHEGCANHLAVPVDRVSPHTQLVIDQEQRRPEVPPCEATVPIQVPIGQVPAAQAQAAASLTPIHNPPARVTQTVLVRKEVEVECIQEQFKFVPKPIVIEVPVTKDKCIHRPMRSPVEVTREVPGEVIEVPVPQKISKYVEKPVYRDTQGMVAVAQVIQPVIKANLEDKEVEAIVYDPDIQVVDIKIPVVTRDNLKQAPGQRMTHKVLSQVSDAEYNTLLIKMNPHIPSGLNLPFRRAADGSIPMLSLEEVPCQPLAPEQQAEPVETQTSPTVAVRHVPAPAVTQPSQQQFQTVTQPSQQQFQTESQHLVEPELIPRFGWPAPAPLAGLTEFQNLGKSQQQSAQAVDRYPLHEGNEVKFTVLPSGRLQIDRIQPNSEIIPITRRPPLQELNTMAARDFRSSSVASSVTASSAPSRVSTIQRTNTTTTRRPLQLFCCNGGHRRSTVLSAISPQAATARSSAHQSEACIGNTGVASDKNVPDQGPQNDGTGESYSHCSHSSMTISSRRSTVISRIQPRRGIFACCYQPKAVEISEKINEDGEVDEDSATEYRQTTSSTSSSVSSSEQPNAVHVQASAGVMSYQPLTVVAERQPTVYARCRDQ